MNTPIHADKAESESLADLAVSTSSVAKRATLVKDNLPDFRGHAALYRCDPPLSDDYGYDAEHTATTYEYVIASTASVLGLPETYLFGSDANGEVVDWSELPGSQKGDVSHQQVFADCGYVVEAS